MILRKMSSSMTLPTIISLFFIGVFAFQTNPSCDTVCICEHSEEDMFVKMDCSRVYLSIVPPVTDWPINITYLDASFNNITTLDIQLDCTTLEVLDLSHNRIKSIVQYAFGGLDSLKYLNLAHNNIKILEINGFYHLDSLKSLNLSNNGLHSLPDNIFSKMLVLEEFSLADNPLIHLDIAHLTHMVGLRWFDLSNTGMYSLPANMFHTTAQLEFLDLSNNDFHDVPTDALRSAKKLKHLRFNENPVELLDKKSFRKLSSLEVLKLNSMDQLKEVKAETFSSLTNLQVLEMKYNRHLMSIDSHAFIGLFNRSRPTLQELDIEGNNLQVLDENVVSCQRMRKFNLQKNPWTCDCRLKWIKDCQIQIVYAADLKCYQPSKVSDALIIDMTDVDFECDFTQTALEKEKVHHDHVSRTISTGIAAGFLVVVAFIIALIFKWNDIRTWYRNKKNERGAVYYVRARANP